MSILRTHKNHNGQVGRSFARIRKAYSFAFVLSSVILSLFANGAYAQSRTDRNLYKISGRVIDTLTGRPIELATFLLDGTQSTLTDKNGCFSLAGVREGEHAYVVFALGFKTIESKMDVKADVENFDVRMNSLNFGLEEVVVTAVPVVMGSSSVINEDAIRHIQPKSLDDMLQLLPGSLAKNPNLNAIGQAAVREISSDANNAMGTAIILDGAPLSNDGNMQALSPTLAGSRTNTSNNGMAQQTASAGGVDMRTISADNVESLEVIRGIPSVEYGNLTSGVVVVKTKAGVTPWEVKFKADPFSKMAYAGKGFALKHGGAVNAGVDWSQSFGDTRKRYMGYDRITASAGYSNVFNSSTRPFVFNLRASFFSNINNQRRDPQMDLLGETFKNSNIGGRLSIEGDWKIGGKVISDLGYSLSASVSHQQDKQHAYVASPNGVVTNTTEAGVQEARFLTQSYYSDYTIDGLPVNVFGVVKASKLVQFLDHSYTNVKIGADWRMDMNKGEGVIYDIASPPQMGGSQTLRPRVFKDIPALHNLSLFAEDKTSVEIGATQLMFQGGVRLTQMFLDKQRAGQGGIFMVEPRVNVSYEVLNRDNNKIFDELSITGGWGISHKAPSMLYLYPDYAYFDNLSLSRIREGEGASIALMTTDVIKSTANANLKPTKSRKWETGIGFAIRQINGVVTYFDERHTDEFGFSSVPHFSRFNRYSVPEGATNLKFSDGVLSYLDKDGNRGEATTVADTLLLTYNVPDNNYMTKKHGVEFSLNFGQIRPLRTSVVVDGAWFNVERIRCKDGFATIRNNYPYMKKYPAGSGTIESRVNTNFRFITHIPRLRLVFSTTVQVVWYESYQNIYRDKNGNDLFALTEDGKNLFVAPVGFLDKNENYTAWQPGFETDSRYDQMVSKYMLTAFDKEVFKPWVMLNFRLTKELGRMLELSFTANNFTNSSRWHVYRHTTGYKQIYPDMYFGAELKIKIGTSKK